jgi:hypothetical protein
MFSSLSKEIYNFFSSLPEFNAVMQRDGETFLFPIVALEGNSLPLTTYYLDERTPETKDRSQLEISIIFWFNQSSYDACCSFVDVMIEKIDGEYNFLSSRIEYNEESFTYSGIVTFNLL